MVQTGIKLGLDVSDFVANAGRAQSSLAALNDAMKKANQEGRVEDYGKLAYEKERLEGRNMAFGRDIQNVISGLHYPAQPPIGGTGVNKSDSDYNEAIKSQVEAMNRLSDEFQKAIASNDIPKAQELSPQLDKQQEEVIRAIRGIGSPLAAPETKREEFSEFTTTTLPTKPKERLPDIEAALQPEKRKDDTPPLSTPETETKLPDMAPPLREQPGEREPPSYIDNMTGGFVSSTENAKNVIKNLERQIAYAKENDDPRLGQLYYTQNRVKAAATSMDLGIGGMFKDQRFQQIAEKQATGQSLTKKEETYVAQLEALNEALKKNTAALLEASRIGDNKEMFDRVPQFETQATDFQRAFGPSPLGGGGQPAVPGGMQGALKAIGINQIAGAINEGFSRYAASLDRSGIVSQYGSGDIMGAQLSEKRRQADLGGGFAQVGLGLAGTIIGALTPAGPVGAMVGGAIGSAAGQLTNTALHLPLGKESTDIAYADLWQQRAPEAMNLAALFGDPTKIRESFKIAADAAASFGYSAEEGMAAIKQATQQGLNEDEARRITEQAFLYERSTGADRNTLSSIANLSARYGAGDALLSGRAGLEASGMKPGQYDEYLRAMQKIMEDGISKGMNRSADQIAQNLAMLANITGNNPLWQGENGARRLSDMNTGLEGATGLSSTSDIMAYQAARNLAPEGSSYIEAMKVMEGGLTPEYFNEYMRMTSNAEGGGREGIVERMRQSFGLNYTSADELYQGWLKNLNMGEGEIQVLLDKYKSSPLPDANSPELAAMKMIQDTANKNIEIGQRNWDTTYPEVLERELGKATAELIQAMTGVKGSGNTALLLSGLDPENMSPHDAQRAKGTFDLMLDKDFFSAGGLFKNQEQKADSQARDYISNTVGNALYSENPLERQMGVQFASLLNSLKGNTREAWDKNNTINTLANYDGIQRMVIALDHLIKLTEENGTRQQEQLEATREDRKVIVNLEY